MTGRALLLVASALAACAGALPPTQVADPAAAAEALAPLPALTLTAREAQLATEIEGFSRQLVAFGPRSAEDTWNLSSATDHIALALEQLGFEVRRHGFLVGEEPLQNLEIVIRGTGAAGPPVVVTAAFDSAHGRLGVNEDAVPSAVLVSLAKRLAAAPPPVEVRLVWLSGENAPATGFGSGAYAANLVRGGTQVRATLTLGGLGNYTRVPNSQQYPAELLYGTERRPSTGNFVAVVANAPSYVLVAPLVRALASPELPVEELVLPDSAPLAADGAQARFWSRGVRGVLLSDTGGYRNGVVPAAAALASGEVLTPDADTFERVDFSRVARLAGKLEGAVSALALVPPPEPVDPNEQPDGVDGLPGFD
jgi:hypothetical protein